MLNKFFNNKIKSSLFLALIIYIFLNILMYFHWEQKKYDVEKFNETKIQNYGIKKPIALIPISLLIGFLQFLVFKNLTKRFYKISDTQTERKKS